MSVVGPVQMAIEKYKLNVRHLAYSISWYAMQCRSIVLDRNKINDEIVKFMTKETINVNFFVMSRDENIIYKNNSLRSIVCEENAKELDKQTWDIPFKLCERIGNLFLKKQIKRKTSYLLKLLYQ